MTRAEEVRQVWKGNLGEEFPGMLEALETASFAALDTEFPGFVHHTALSAGSRERYEDVRRNVDGMKLLQLGVSLFDSRGQKRRAWQINLGDFDLSSPSDLRWEASVELLRNCGLDFERTRREGVESAVLSALLRRCNWTRRRKPLWVTYQGLYDVAYLLKLLTRRPLPRTLPEFARLAGETLGRVFDVKHATAFFGGGFRLGLAPLSRSLGLTVEGASAHQAGADSLLVGMIFSRMAQIHGGRLAQLEGILHGIEDARIVPSPWPPVRPRIVPSPCPPMPPPLVFVPGANAPGFPPAKLVVGGVAYFGQWHPLRLFR